MDFVEWCDFVLNVCIEVIKTSPEARTIGVDEYELAQALSDKIGIVDFRSTMFAAIKSLKAVDLIENNERSNSHWKVSRLGHRYVSDRTPLWSTICHEQLDIEHIQLLSLINRLSPQHTPDHAWLKPVDHQTIIAELGNWSAHDTWNVAKELHDWGYVSGFFSAANTITLEATYKGLAACRREAEARLPKMVY